MPTKWEEIFEQRWLEQNDVEQGWQTSKIFTVYILYSITLSPLSSLSLYTLFLRSLLPILIVLHVPFLWFWARPKQLFGEKSRLWTLAGDWKAPSHQPSLWVCRVSPVLVELSCLCLRRWRCRKATFFAARTNMMPGRKMISGGKMNTHASTQRRWTRRVLMWERSHRPSMCVAWKEVICPTCAKKMLDCPSLIYISFFRKMQVMEFSKTAYQLTSMP